MSRQPKVSVIIPVYNTEKYLRECLDSVVNQTLGDIEIILVDDGSTDGSLEILREYEADDSRIHILTQKNAFAGAARNLGMEFAHGKYLLFLDSDDYFDLNMLKKTTALAQKYDADITLFGGKRFDDSTGKMENVPWWIPSRKMVTIQPFSARDVSNRIFQLASPGPCNKLFKASFVRGLGLKFQEFPNTNDLFFVFSALSEAEKICYTEDQFYFYRVNTGTSTQDRKSKNPKCFYYALNAVKARLKEVGTLDMFGESFVKFADANCNFNFRAYDESVLSKKEREEIRRELTEFTPVARPAISVIVPVYNAEKYLRDCLDSVIFQSLDDIEIICVDDGSTDSSLDILSEYEAKDSRIKLIIKKENQGLLQARKDGVMLAEGKYIAFVEPDDQLLPDACEKMFSSAEKSKAEICQFGVDVVNYTDVEGATAWHEKSFQPKAKTMAGDALMNSFFVQNENATTLWSKLYSRELCQTVYSKIPDRYCYVGEDIFTFYFMCLYCRTYAGFPEIKVYRYNYGLSVGNKENVSLSKFEQYCNMSDCVRYSQQFLNGHISNEINATGLQAMGTRMFTDCCSIFSDRVSEDDKPAAAKMLKSKWEEFDFCENVINKEFGMSPMELWRKNISIPRYYREAPAYIGNSAPKVSVVIPVYEVEQFLRPCLDSIVNQTLKDIEIICVNDGSLDDSLNIVEEYATMDERIAVISKRNGGQSSARNRGLDAAHGKYIYFFDGDDLLTETALQELYEAAENEDLDIVFFCANSFFENASLKETNATYMGYYHRKPHPELRSSTELMQIYQNSNEFRASVPLQFFNREFVVNSRIRFFEGIIIEDELFSALILAKARRVRILTDRFYQRRVRSSSTMTQNMSHKRIEGTFIVAINIFVSANMYSNDERIYEFLCKRGKALLDSMKRSYKQLSAAEQKKVFAENHKEYSAIFYGQWYGAPTVAAKTSPVANPGPVANPCVDEATLIRASASYKIGRFVTFLPRKIRGGIRCYKEHGWEYTMWRLKVHAKSFFGIKGK